MPFVVSEAASAALSIITTTDCRADYLDRLVEGVDRIAADIPGPVELLVVDDRKLWASASSARLPKVHHIALVPLWYPQFRGQAAALAYGARRSKGAAILTIDPDMYPCCPDILRFWEQFSAGHSLIHGVRPVRPEADRTRRWGSRVANSLFRVLAGVHIRDIGSPMSLCSRGLFQRTQSLQKGVHPRLYLYIRYRSVLLQLPLSGAPDDSRASTYTLTGLCRQMLLLVLGTLRVRLSLLFG
ncbi:MAG: glycosyltransferase [Alcanivorax sp.]|nr:glycosyltransferase [Alcanivorax sp.]